MRRLLVAAILCAFASSVFAQDDQKIDRMVADAHKVFEEGTIDWKDEPILPKGAKSALVVGDPSKAGVQVSSQLRHSGSYPPVRRGGDGPQRSSRQRLRRDIQS